MDRAGNKTTFITGLQSPNNIMFGSLPFGSGYLVLDSNTVEVYDSTGDNIATQSFSGAKKLQDCVFDEAAGVLYTSDVLRGVIYKTTFGPAPFYLPSTSIFASGIARPSAMILQKAKNRILFVQDTSNSDLKELNLSSGNVSKVRSLGLNNVVGLAEDGQGNLYISSQGEKYIYQLNRFYAGNPVKLVSEPKPGDLTVNIEKDEWVYTCILCGTVFIPRLHVFGPGNEQEVCVGDSVIGYKNILQKCIGTFEAGNEFIMELSNSSGQFSSPVFLGKVKDTLVPYSISGKLPNTVKNGNYRYRWRSTRPAITGTFETFVVNAAPLAFVADSRHADSIYGCTGTKLKLGKGNAFSAQVRYSWTPSSAVDSTDIASPSHVFGLKQKIRVQVENMNTGCKSADSAWMIPVSKPDAGNFADTLKVCFNDTAILGNDAKAGLTYSWSPGKMLNDSSLAEPAYIAVADQEFSLVVSAGSGCTDSRTQYVKVLPLPGITLNASAVIFNCRFDTFMLKAAGNIGNLDLFWKRPNGNITKTDSLLIVNSGQDVWGNYVAEIKDRTTGCRNLTDPVSVSGKPFYRVSIRLTGDSALTDTAVLTSSRKWYRNDTLLVDTAATIYPKASGFYKVCGVSIDGCNACSGSVAFILRTTAGFYGQKSDPACLWYPNPARDIVRRGCIKTIPDDWSLWSSGGVRISSGNSAEIDLSGLPTGIYFIRTGTDMVKVLKD